MRGSPSPITSSSRSTLPRIPAVDERSSTIGLLRDIRVSGDVRLFDQNGETRRLVLALEKLVGSVSTERFALIGGLAVMARLGQAHRVTQDIDPAVGQGGPIPSEVGVVVDTADPAGKMSPDSRVKVDAIDVGATPAIDLSPEELPDRKVPSLRRWAPGSPPLPRPARCRRTRG